MVVHKVDYVTFQNVQNVINDKLNVHLWSKKNCMHNNNLDYVNIHAVILLFILDIQVLKHELLL